MVDGVLLRPLPYRDPQQLVVLRWKFQQREPAALTAAQFNVMRENARVFQSIAAYVATTDLEWRSEDRSFRAGAVRISSGFFAVLGIRPALGHLFDTDEERPGGTRINHFERHALAARFRSRAGCDRPRRGGSGGAHAIAAVLPPSFPFGEGIDVFLPLKLGEADGSRGANPTVIARLAPGLGPREAQAALQVTFTQYRETITHSRPGRTMAGALVICL